MEFLLYLTPVGNEIVNSLASAKFHIYENSGPCKVERIFGYAKYPNKLFICTENIKSLGYNPNIYVGETLYHESTHAAQFCRKRKSFGFNDRLGLSKEKMPISYHKQKDIQNAVKITKNYSWEHQEHEAFYLEDKPEQVLKYIKKFCF